jgi:N6-L-threonylcarbamoyladenine synthase
MPTGLILGIESSCDETAAAVVERGARTLSSVVASQISTHARFGGVVPELASREHLRAILPVVRAAIAEAGITLSDLDAVAVTSGPGLVGALLVGITFAKSLAFALGKPLIAVNHLEGHIHAVLLNQRQQNQELEGTGFSPYVNNINKNSGALAPEGNSTLALVVSGGHTHLYRAHPIAAIAEPKSQLTWHYSLVGRTLDDAAGEAYDKVAKLLGLPYPGGPWIDVLACFGNPHAVPFTFAQIKQKPHLIGKTPRTKGARTAPVAALDPHFLFSFSGIKTAVLRYAELHHLRISPEAAQLNADTRFAQKPQTHAEALALCPQITLDLIASFQHAVVGDLLKKTFAAAESLGCTNLLITGGVAANHELRTRFTTEAQARGLSIAFPTFALSTDNAAMIAAAAWPRFLAQDFAPLSLSASPTLALG